MQPHVSGTVTVTGRSPAFVTPDTVLLTEDGRSWRGEELLHARTMHIDTCSPLGT